MPEEFNGTAPKILISPDFLRLMEPFEQMTGQQREAAALALMNQLVTFAGLIAQQMTQAQRVIVPDPRHGR